MSEMDAGTLDFLMPGLRTFVAMLPRAGSLEAWQEDAAMALAMAAFTQIGCMTSC
jgi:hypothetical protein